MIHYENIDQEKVAGWMIQLAAPIRSREIILSDEEIKNLMTAINEIYSNHSKRQQGEATQER